MVKVGINGFGRIGRLILRAILENYKNNNLNELGLDSLSIIPKAVVISLPKKTFRRSRSYWSA
mgnify:CR=1 FL=1